MKWSRDDYWLTDDASALDGEAVCRWLQSTYWASTRSREVILKCIDTSLNFGLFHNETPIGYARVITDFATHGYLCDVFVVAEERRQGLGKWMLQCILDHPELNTVRMDLFTKDAQEFYKGFGFGRHRFDCLVHYPPDYAGGSNFAADS